MIRFECLLYVVSNLVMLHLMHDFVSKTKSEDSSLDWVRAINREQRIREIIEFHELFPLSKSIKMFSRKGTNKALLKYHQTLWQTLASLDSSLPKTFTFLRYSVIDESEKVIEEILRSENALYQVIASIFAETI